MIHAVAVNGSPRPKGNTFLLLSTVMAELEAAGIKTQLLGRQADETFTAV